MSWRLLVFGIPTADARSSPQLPAELASTATFKTLALHLGCIMSNHGQPPRSDQDRAVVVEWGEIVRTPPVGQVHLTQYGNQTELGQRHRDCRAPGQSGQRERQRGR